MSGIIGMLIFLIFSFIWYFPLYKSKPADKKPEPKLFWKAFLMGLGPAFIVGLILPIIIGYLIKLTDIPKGSVLYLIITHGIGYGVGEELSKFLIAYLILKKEGFKNKSHTSLLFGAVGLGFGVFESWLVVSNILTAIGRGFFCLHVFFQLWMGMYYGDYIEKNNAEDAGSAKKSLILAFAVPMFVHATHDVVGTLGLNYLSSGDENMLVSGLLMFVVSIVIDAVFVITTLKKVRKL